MTIDRKELYDHLGGEAAVAAMSHEARADALEDFQIATIDARAEEKRRTHKFPTVAELEAKVETRSTRLGMGKIFRAQKGKPNPDGTRGPDPVKLLPKMPEKSTLIDFFNLRFRSPAHLLQSAALARRRGCSEEVVMACLLHDVGGFLMKTDHGLYGAQLIEPYVSERISFAVRYHQALRFYPDASVNYEYPVRYYDAFGIDYEPPPHTVRAYEYARNHKWYMDARLVTCNDLYAFNPDIEIDVEDFRDLIGRHWRDPEAGLGYDDSPVAHMWRTFINPDACL